MRPLDALLIGAGTLALCACIYFALELRITSDRPRVSSRIAVTAGLVFLNAYELALHRVPVLDVVLLATGLLFMIAGIAITTSPPRK
jgi:hypothetical protein